MIHINKQDTNSQHFMIEVNHLTSFIEHNEILVFVEVSITGIRYAIENLQK